jgi:hypothetical protein
VGGDVVSKEGTGRCEQGELLPSCLLACLAFAFCLDHLGQVRSGIDSISLTHARLAGFGWTTFPWYATHTPALHAAVLRCLVPGLRTTGLGGTFFSCLDAYVLCCADRFLLRACRVHWIGTIASRQVLVIAAWREDYPFPLRESFIMLI